MATVAERIKNARARSGTSRVAELMRPRLQPLVEQRAIREEREKKEAFQRYLNDQKSSLQKSVEDYRKRKSSIPGMIKTFFGFGEKPPTLFMDVGDKSILVESPEYTNERLAPQPTFRQNLSKLFTGSASQSAFDIFHQKEIDKQLTKNIENNVNVIKTLIQRNKTEKDEEKKRRREETIKNLLEMNKTMVETSGGELAKKTFSQLVGQSIGTSLDLTPFLGFKSLATTTGKALLGFAKKGGIRQAMKEASQLPLKDVISEGALFGGTAGFSGELEQPGATVGSVAKSTAFGTGVGAGLAGTIGIIASKLGSKYQKVLDDAIIDGKIKPDEVNDAFIDKGSKGVEELLDKKVISQPDIRSIKTDDIEPSVVQIINPKTNQKEFYTIPKGKLQEFHNTIGESADGKVMPDGKIYKLTDNTPEKMAELGFEYKGEAKLENIPKSKNILEKKNAPEETIKTIAERAKKADAEIREKEKVLLDMEKQFFQEEKLLNEQPLGIWGDEEYQFNQFKKLVARSRGKRQREALLHGDSDEIKAVLKNRLKPEELDNILYSTDKTNDEMLERFQFFYNKSKKPSSDELRRRVHKRLETDADYLRAKEELENAIARRKDIALEEERLIEKGNRELQEAKSAEILKEKIETPKEKVAETPKEPKKKSITAQRYNETFGKEYKIDEEYDPITINRELDEAAETIAKDKDAALDYAVKDGGDIVKKQAILSELFERAREIGDGEAMGNFFSLLRENSTRNAQAMNIMKAVKALNPHFTYMEQVVSAKLKKVNVSKYDIGEATKRLSIQEKVEMKLKDTSKQIKEKLDRAFKIEDAQKLFDSLTC